MNEEKSPYKLDDYLADIIIQCVNQVHKTLGPGYPESVYKNAMMIELNKCNIETVADREAEVFYEKQKAGSCRLDLIAGGRIVILIRTGEKLNDNHAAQMKIYLQAAGMKTGIITNFALEKTDFIIIDL